MKYFELKAIQVYLGGFRTVTSAGRYADRLVGLTFDKERLIFFDMQKGSSGIYIPPQKPNLPGYTAPFDRMLQRRIEGARIVRIYLRGDDKLLCLDVRTSGAYKAQATTLQMEFTGRNTNAILLDDADTVIEALRHIGPEQSSRIVKPGIRLQALPAYDGQRMEGGIGDVEAWLCREGLRRTQADLATLKRAKIALLEKKMKKIATLLRNLPDAEALRRKSRKAEMSGQLVLANLQALKPYATLLEVEDFEGCRQTIELPKLPNPRRIGDYFFALSRRYANKARNLHIEKENLLSRKTFYERMIHNIRHAATQEVVELLMPRQKRGAKKKEAAVFEVFWIEGYKLMVGRNERENAALLKQARAGDWWLHLKDRPSAHCIIGAGNKQLPKNVLQKAASVCVQVSETQPGDYLVDITQRRHVKIIEGAKVNYTDYTTLKVRKE